MDTSVIVNILLFLMIIAAIITVEATSLLAANISMGAIGLLLSITYLILGAPEIAISQIVVEILILIILIRATINRDLTSLSGDREFFGLTITIGLIFFIALFGLKIFDVLPHFGDSILDRLPATPSQHYLSDGIKQSGSENIIESILFTFRSFDLLILMAVLFCGVFGAISLIRRKTHKRPEDAEVYIDDSEITPSVKGMSLMVRTVTRWVKGFLMLFGIYLILMAHKSPGGGLTGGVIIACSFILILLAQGAKKKENLSRNFAVVIASLSSLLFLMSIFSQQFSHTMHGQEQSIRLSFSDHMLQIMSSSLMGEICIGCMVASVLFLVFSLFTMVHVRVKDGKREMVSLKRE